MGPAHDNQGRPVVVVTGMGIITSLGAGKADNWAKLTAGESGIRRLTRFSNEGLKTTIAGAVDFVPVEPFCSTELGERMARMVADEAIAEAGIGRTGDFPGPLFLAVAPVEIERIDMMWGPFSAAYAGNSMGAVMEITTRLPQKLEGSISQTQAVQTFDLYDTKDRYGTSQTAASLGDRIGSFSFWASGTHQNSYSQPLSYVTSATFPSGTTCGFAAENKLGAPAKELSGVQNSASLCKGVHRLR